MRRSKGRGSSCISSSHHARHTRTSRSPAHKEQNRNKFVTERCSGKPSGRPIEAYPAGGRYRTRYRVGESTVVLGYTAHGYFLAVEASPMDGRKHGNELSVSLQESPCGRRVTQRCENARLGSSPGRGLACQPHPLMLVLVCATSPRCQ